MHGQEFDECCAQGSLERLRFWVAVRVAYDVTVWIGPADLRQALIEHITDRWRQCLQVGGHEEGFDGFFRDYCAIVERDIVRGQPDDLDIWEYQRVWLNHAHRVAASP